MAPETYSREEDDRQGHYYTDLSELPEKLPEGFAVMSRMFMWDSAFGRWRSIPDRERDPQWVSREPSAEDARAFMLAVMSVGDAYNNWVYGATWYYTQGTYHPYIVAWNW